MKNNNIKGIITGLILGYISTIPWILSTIYIDLFIPILAIPVGIVVYFGYKLFCNNDSKTPWIITSISLFIIVSSVLVTIPSAIIYKSEFSMSFDTLFSFYQDNLTDFLYKLFFAVVIGYIGINKSIAKINNELESNVSIKLDTKSEIVDTESFNMDDIQSFFQKKDATSINTVISKKELKEYITSFKKKREVNNLLASKVIKKYKNGYYLDTNIAKSQLIFETDLGNTKVIVLVTIVLVVISTAVIFAILTMKP